MRILQENLRSREIPRTDARILESIVTTLNEDGSANIAPMGPIVDSAMERFLLRPFRDSATYRNLKRTGQGILHVTDDVVLFARAAVNCLESHPPMVRSQDVEGWILSDACRWWAFRVESCDDSQERACIAARVVGQGVHRDFFGFNRAKHAVIETAILATRLHLLDRDDVLAEVSRLAVPVAKTAGRQEQEAFDFLEQYIHRWLDSAGWKKATVKHPSEARQCCITVTAPSRLHLGFFGFGGKHGRQFGGVGVMIDTPYTQLEFTPALRFDVVGVVADRVRAVVERVSRAWRLVEPPACRIRVLAVPRRHVGLGSGTQLALAVAAGMYSVAGKRRPPAAELAQIAGRGARSGIGTHGFDRGGLLVDRGKSVETDVSPLAFRVELDPAWRFVLFTPANTVGLSGDAESAAFAKLPPVPSAIRRRLRQMAFRRLVPAARAGDFAAFASALYEYNRMAGECYSACQGGPFAGPALARAVEQIRSMGVLGVAQSSWGPTLACAMPDDASARDLVERLGELRDFPNAERIIASPNRRGAVLERIEWM